MLKDIAGDLTSVCDVSGSQNSNLRNYENFYLPFMTKLESLQANFKNLPWKESIYSVNTSERNGPNIRSDDQAP